MLVWRADVEQQLAGLKADHSKRYSGLTRAQAAALTEIVKDLDCWSGRESGSTCSSDFLVIRPGAAHEKLRKAIDAVPSGEFLQLKHLGKEFREFAQIHCEQLGFLITSGECDRGDLEVWNLAGQAADFAAGTRHVLQRLKLNEELCYPAALPSERRELVFSVASGLPLIRVADVTFDQVAGCVAKEARVAVGNLSSWHRTVQLDLVGLDEGESKDYGFCLPPLHAWLVRHTASEVGCKILDSCDALGRMWLSVFRPMPVEGEEDADAEDEVGPITPEKVQKWCQDVFKKYASRQQGDTSVFVRKPDLLVFVDDSHRLRIEMMSKKNGVPPPSETGRAAIVQKMLGKLDKVFDETYELQKDFGSKARHGLTFDFFQVFLSKVAEAQGWSLMSLLFTLLGRSHGRSA